MHCRGPAWEARGHLLKISQRCEAKGNQTTLKSTNGQIRMVATANDVVIVNGCSKRSEHLRSVLKPTTCYYQPAC